MSLRHVRLISVAIRNLRDFQTLDLDFSKPGPYVIIGRNGTCKTTLLRALAASVAGELGLEQLQRHAGSLARNTHGDDDGGPGSPLDFHSVIRTSNGPVTVRFCQDIGFENYQNKEAIGLAASGFVAAYGVSRFFSGPDSNPSREYSFSDATATLFNIPRPLTDPELTIRRLKDRLGDSNYAQIWNRLKLCVGLTESDSIELRQGGGIDVLGPGVGGKVDFYSWADGFRITTTWLLDFFAQAMKASAFDENGDIAGILLVDEIEQHLHPSMQLEILPKLQTLLPKCQIIVTTHSPLVALSVSAENVISLQKERNGMVVRVPTPNLKGLSAEDVLTHRSLFDSPSETAETTKARTIYAEAVRSQSSFGGPNVKLAAELLARRRLQDIDPGLERSLADILAKVESQR